MRSEQRRFTLWALAWPIFVELFLQFLLGTADTIMVSRISDDAVAVVGFSNQLFNALMILFTMTANGGGILIAQRIGAGRREEARSIGLLVVNVCLAVGIALSLLLSFQARPLARLLGLEERLLPLADTYISIVGGGMVLTALMMGFGSVIRNTGNTRTPMYVSLGMNVVHVILNYLFIFGALGFPKWGLTGVAVSTVVCRLLGAAILLFVFVHAFDRKVLLREFAFFDRKLFGEIFRIAWPLGLNGAAWVFSQLAIYAYLAMLGAKELAARTYMNTLESFCFMLGWAIAMGLQIQIAHLFGAGKTREAYRGAYRGMWIGLALVMPNAVIIYLIGETALGFFTRDQEIIAMGMSLLALNLLLQPAKMVNMAMGNALNAVGDTRFNMVMAVLFMGGIAGVLSYVLGVRAGWGLPGIYLCMILDEAIRGVGVLLRWRGRKRLRERESASSPPDTPGRPARGRTALEM
jgi:putative MATE family efflux protein